MNPVTLNLDLDKRPAETQVVYIRQGERNANAVRAVITDAGEAVVLSNYAVYFEMRHPGGALLQYEVTDVSGNEASLTVPEQAAKEVGLASVAYFSLKTPDGSVYATTAAFAVMIAPNAQCDSNAVAKAYSSEIERMLDWCESEFLKAEGVREQKVDAAIARADAATALANEAASKVDEALKGNLGPVFDVYLEEKKDVSGGFVSWERYTGDHAFLGDDEFVEYVTGDPASTQAPYYEGMTDAEVDRMFI